MQRFQDKVIVITGAGSGIGAATAWRFADEGANVVLVGRTADKLEKLAATLPCQGQKVLIRPTDVADADQVKSLFDEVIDTFGRLDVLVNNAGTAVQGKLAEASDDDWRKVMSTNVDGVFYCCRAALPHLLESKGNIVNTSSVSGLGGDWGMSIYNTSKGAISNLTRALALDHGGDGVRVNAVCPSLTRSELTAGMFDNDELMAKFAERMPMGRAAEPEEVADVIAFLASDDARFVNGVNLPVDGGLSASNGQPRLG
ncbi:SDR family NAD(P)-dependent oxidoreductase [Salinisphaera aquimarina]|uniref:SDR family NAD(P)-dependent oxidoreductase n=1 Tax=Salinisphaera aquimarina TaxID=2094031 RepID=A0ABV7EMZ5_9GAMM